MIGFYIVSLAFFLGYIAVIIARYGVPTSISESYYLVPSKWSTPVFYGFTIVTALPLLIFWLDCSEGTAQILIFLACASFAFVGVAGAFKQQGTRTIHFIAAGACALFSQIWIVIYTQLWPISIELFIIAILISLFVKGRDAEGRKRNAWLFFVEMAAFLSVYYVVLEYYST